MKGEKIVLTIASFSGGIIGYLFGEIDGFFYGLIAMMGIDYLTGVLSGVAQKNISSRIGFRGICKKAIILMMVAFGNIVDGVILEGSSVARTGIITFFLVNEGISIAENAAAAGVPVPKKITDMLKQLKEK